MATPFLKRKSGQALLIIASVLALVYSLQGWGHLREMTHTRALDRDLKAALDASHSQPAGIAQMEDFLVRLKRIDPGQAPADVKQALAEYVAALEAAIKAFRAGENLAPYDREMEKTQKRLAAVVNEHWY
jgi:hypothetical protein